MTDLPFHPLANLFPLIEGAEFDELVADIAANGLREPIILLDGQILDGRNRYRACVKAGIIQTGVCRSREGGYLPQFSLFLPKLDGDPLTFVLSKNLHRRHLNESQRALVAAKLANMRQGARTDLEPSANLPKVDDLSDQAAHLPLEIGGAEGRAGAAGAGEPSAPAISQAQAAEALKVSARSVRTAKSVIEKAAPEVVQAVERGALSVSAAADLATLPAAEQKRLIDASDPKAIRAAAKELRAADTEAKKAKRAEKERALGDSIAAANARLAGMIADGRTYGVIYADPEWRFEPYSRETGMDRAPENHYPTTPTLDIVTRPVGRIAAKDSVLFLWATAPMLPAALKVMTGWGFAYKSCLVWDKMRAGTGYWFRNRHELLLVGTMGNPPAPAMGTQWASVLEAMAGEHSAKPVEIYQLIEAYFPNLPKIELNARTARPGWDVWGAEAPSSPLPGGERSAGEAAPGEGASPRFSMLPPDGPVWAGCDVSSAPDVTLEVPDFLRRERPPHEPVASADASGGASA